MATSYQYGAAVLHFVRQLYRNSKGGAAVEYALMCAFIVLAMMAALFQFGDVTSNLWNTIDNKVAAHPGD